MDHDGRLRCLGVCIDSTGELNQAVSIPRLVLATMPAQKSSDCHRPIMRGRPPAREPTPACKAAPAPANHTDVDPRRFGEQVQRGKLASR